MTTTLLADGKSTIESEDISVSTPNLNDAIRLFILNLPEVVALRKAAEEAGSGPDPDALESAVQTEVESRLKDELDWAIENFDFSDAIESAIQYGYFDWDAILSINDLVIEKVGDSTELAEAIEKADDAERQVLELEERVETIERALNELGNNF